MGCYMSKSHSQSTKSAVLLLLHGAEVSLFEASCKSGGDLQLFDTRVRSISDLLDGLEVRSDSFGSLMVVTKCVTEMNQKVVGVILQCKEDIWGNQELFKHVEEYFDNSLQTLEFCAAMEKCLKRAKDSQLLVLAALKEYNEERETGSDTCSKTLKELKYFREAGDPFTDEFFPIFQSVYQQQMKTLQKLEQRKKNLDRKLKLVNAWGKVSNVTFLTAFALVLISSVCAAAPVVAAALSASCSIPIRLVGKWVDSLWKNYEMALKGQKAVINSMQVGTFVAVKDLDNIRALVERLEVDIASMLNNAELATDEGALNLRIANIGKRLGSCTKNIENLCSQADACSRDITRARTAILQQIMKNPSNK